MNEITALRTSIRKFEDRKITVAQLGRDVMHAAHQIREGEYSPIRMALVRLANRLIGLAERSLHDDVNDEIRGYIDELHEQLVDI